MSFQFKNNMFCKRFEIVTVLPLLDRDTGSRESLFGISRFKSSPFSVFIRTILGWPSFRETSSCTEAKVQYASFLTDCTRTTSSVVGGLTFFCREFS